MARKPKTKIKLKTNRGAAKRFKKTATGKIRFRRANRNHIKTKQSTSTVRGARANGVMKDCDSPSIHRLLPNS